MNSTSILGKGSYTGLQDQYDMHGANDMASIVKRYQMAMLPGLEQQVNYSLGLEQHRQTLINQLLNSLTPASMRAAGQQQKNSIFENAARAGGQAAMNARGMGLGDGAQAGLLAGAMNQAARHASQVDDQYNNPIYRNQLLGQALGLVDQGMAPSFLQQMLMPEEVVMGQNQFNEATRGQGLLGALAPIAGAYFGQNPGALKWKRGGGNDET